MTMPASIRAAFVEPAHNGKPGEGVWHLELPSSPPRILEVTAVPSGEKTHKWSCVGYDRVLEYRIGGVGNTPEVALASLVESFEDLVAGRWPANVVSRDPRLPDDPVEVLPLTPADELQRLGESVAALAGSEGAEAITYGVGIKLAGIRDPAPPSPGLARADVEVVAGGVQSTLTLLTAQPPAEPAGATFSIDKKRRLHLWRPITHLTPPRWTCSLLAVLLNPSIAGLKGPDDNDLTVKKLIGYAERWGFPRVDVVNAYDWIATNPGDLGVVADPVGSQDSYILALASGRIPATPTAAARDLPGGRPLVLVGWGDDIDKARADRVLHILWSAKRMPHHLGLTQRKNPRHPSRLPYALEPTPWVERCDDCVGPVWSST